MGNLKPLRPLFVCAALAASSVPVELKADIFQASTLSESDILENPYSVCRLEWKSLETGREGHGEWFSGERKSFLIQAARRADSYLPQSLQRRIVCGMEI